MRILHYMFGTPPVRTGGLVRYALDLIRQEARIGETVILLLPGTLPKNTDRRIRIRKSRSRIRRILTYTIDNPLPIPKIGRAPSRERVWLMV